MKIIHVINVISIFPITVFMFGCTIEEFVDNPLLSEPDYSYVCSYFVDSENGDNNKDGMTEETAWRTFDRVTIESREIGFKPGDAICFKRGQRFVMRDPYLGGGSTGARGNFVFYGAYGTGEKPKLSAAIRIDALRYWENDLTLPGNNFGPPAEWYLYDAVRGIFLWPNSSTSWKGSGLWEDKKYMRQATSLENVGASNNIVGAGDWYYDDQIGVYYKPSDGQPPSTHEIYFAKEDVIFVIHQSSYLVFQDLAFEYSGRGIAGGVFAIGGKQAVPIHDIAVINCEFNYVARPVELVSELYEGVKYENHDLVFRDNIFNNLRYALQLHSSNTAAGVRNVEIKNNVVRNLALNGDYVAFGKTDIEAFSLQNPVNIHISGNDIRYGLKFVEGIVNEDQTSYYFGHVLKSFGIVTWTAPGITMSNALIENNFISGVHAGMGVGTDGGDTMRNVIIVNNIVTNSEIGLKLHATSSDNSYVAAHNTLFSNEINLEISGVNAVALIGNISANPVDYHVLAFGFSGQSTVDYNGYTGGLFKVAKYDGNTDLILNNLTEWKQIAAVDSNSIEVTDPRFVSLFPESPEDFKLSSDSLFIDFVPDITGVVDSDISLQTRSGFMYDIGAWEH